MKKRLLLYTAYGKIKGNIWNLNDFYERFLKDKLPELEVIFLDSQSIAATSVEKKSAYLRRNLALFYPRLLLDRKVDYWVSDSEGNFLSRFSRGIELSHGYGTKKTPGEGETKTFRFKVKEKTFLEKLDTFITLSDFEKTYYYSSDTTQHHAEYLPLGLPRNDRLFDEAYISESKCKFYKEHELSDDTQLVLYAPTWREYEIEKDPMSRKMLEKFNEELRRLNLVLLYRPHYCGPTIKTELIEGLSNFIYCGNEIMGDSQEALVISDYMITDYSSIFVDYLLLNRPVCFYTFDLEQYIVQRGLVIDYNNDQMTPGPKCNNLLELIPYFQQLKDGKDEYAEIRKAGTRFFHKYADGNSTKRVWQHLLKKLEIEYILDDEIIKEEEGGPQ
ncbi:hypothetical protein Ami103574_01970 [Aminipila butyrica]|uniref:CDP-glycerol:poly(Glycerophosphate) glycerophosphotransferase n=1 Tax=Aminipila butyrica TaxID=433296 RepID=A0A858BSF9_9FIRM|nr:CDP-glycerol glycerophosphotransferase family protein [Aminipila butyrica]QIB68149.1 hypothetical protein Ami103574_01970 [Aminipila butyrica]